MPSQKLETAITAVDLSTGRLQTILRHGFVDSTRDKGWQITGPELSDDSPYILFQEARNPDPSRSSSNRIQRSFTLHMPNKAKVYMQGIPGQFVAGQYAISRGIADRFQVWSAATGQRMTTSH